MDTSHSVPRLSRQSSLICSRPPNSRRVARRASASRLARLNLVRYQRFEMKAKLGVELLFHPRPVFENR